jgi:CheY-like chemotaxis protein
VCDHEPYWEGLWSSEAEPGKLDSILHAGDRTHAEFIQDADVVIHDAQYTPEEYPAKKNWGHSTWAYATQVAVTANVKRLFLTHHDPNHNDDFLSRIEERSRELAASLGSALRVSCAFEGCEESYENKAAAAPDPACQVFEQPPCGVLTVLVVDDDEDIRFLARRSLGRGDYDVLEAGSGAEALILIEQRKPDLVILDLLIPPPDGLELLRRLRANEETRALPVLVLTAQGDEESVQTCFRLGATDFLSKPFTPPQLDARVRACFVRGASS